MQRATTRQGAEESARGDQLEKALFLRLRDWCLARNCRLFVVTTGYNAFPDFPLGLASGNVNRKFFSEAPEFFQKNGIAFYDTGPEMFAAARGDYRQLVIPGDLHPDERGAGLLAGFTWLWLQPQLRQMSATQDKPRAIK